MNNKRELLTDNKCLKREEEKSDTTRAENHSSVKLLKDDWRFEEKKNLSLPYRILFAQLTELCLTKSF